jgi:hypothetical protein
MRPSDTVRHFWPLRNQRFFWSRLRSKLLVERLGTHTRFTPLAAGKSSAQMQTRARILLKADVSEAGEGWSDKGGLRPRG